VNAFEPNPPWANDVIRTQWLALERAIGDWRFMPFPRDASAWPPLRSDSLGCTLPTASDAVWLRLTADDREAFSAESLRQLGTAGWPTVHAVVQLPVALRRRPVFAIWRSAATDVGLADTLRALPGEPEGAVPDRMRLVALVAQYARRVGRAQAAFRRSKDWGKTLAAAAAEAAWAVSEVERRVVTPDVLDGLRGGRRLALGIAAARATAGAIASLRSGRTLGLSLASAIASGLLPANVSPATLGRALGGVASEWVAAELPDAIPLSLEGMLVQVPAAEV